MNTCLFLWNSEVTEWYELIMLKSKSRNNSFGTIVLYLKWKVTHLFECDVLKTNYFCAILNQQIKFYKNKLFFHKELKKEKLYLFF